MLPSPHGIVLIAHGTRQLHRGRQTVAIAAQLPNHGADAGRITAVELRFARTARSVAQPGQIVMDANPVRVRTVKNGSQDREALSLLCHHRQEFANLHARYAGRDRPKLATNVFGGVWLRVERFMLRRPARHVEQDACLRRAGPCRRCLSGRAKPHRLTQAKPNWREQARLQKSASVHHLELQNPRQGSMRLTVPTYPINFLARLPCCASANRAFSGMISGRQFDASHLRCKRRGRDSNPR